MRVTEIDDVFVAKMVAGLQTLSELADEVSLQIVVFQNGFHHEVAIGKVGKLGRGTDARQRRIAVLGLDLSARGETLEALADGRHASIQILGFEVVQDDRVTGCRKGLGDPVPHGSGPYDADMPDLG
jgi:hypothetical protein